jgi:hypothetical protein
VANATLQRGTTASEEMYFDGAPLAHVVLYYDRKRDQRLANMRARSTVDEYFKTVDWLNSIEREGGFMLLPFPPKAGGKGGL